MDDSRRPTRAQYLKGGMIAVLVEVVALATLVLLAWAVAVVVTAID